MEYHKFQWPIYSNLSMNLLLRMSSFINVSSLSKKLYCSPNGGNVHVLGVRQQFGIDNRVLPFATPSATVDLGCKRLFSAPHKCMHCTSARGGPAMYACAVIFLQDDRKPQYTPERILESN